MFVGEQLVYQLYLFSFPCLTGFGMVKESLGECAFYGRGKPQCFITDNCEAERKALATTWPTAMLFLCIFHILQQVWHWLLDSKHGIHKEHRKELMHMMKSLVYATSRGEFSAKWNEVETSPLLEKCSNFRRCLYYSTYYYLVHF